MSGGPQFPPNPTVGQLYTFGTTTWQWNGTQWVNATAGQNFLPLTGGTLTGPLVLSGNGTAPLNPVSLQQLQAGYLPLTGGTLAGPGNLTMGTLSMTGNQTIANASPTIVLSNTAGPGVTTGNLWRMILGTNGTLGIVMNTAPAGDFTSAVNALLLAPSTGTATVAGNIVVNSSTYPAGGLAGSTISNLNGGWRWANNPNSFSFVHNPAVDPIFEWLSNTINLMNLNSGGQLTIAANLIQGSDATSKTNISPLTRGISLVRQLIPKAFAWLSSPTVTQLGFIAQDVQPVIPETISQGPAKPDGSAGTLGLDINGIVAVLCYALKQLDQRCTALEANANITPPAGELA